MRKGFVYLVGAGPGDYKLISLKGRECIEQADVIIYDRLIDDRLLAFACPEAERIYVGKAVGEYGFSQPAINKLLLDKACEGLKVVRLKGGDPFVFGRGGEEALVLQEAGIGFAVVPGVSAATAVPAYAGIPVTHRGVAASFAVVTGHEDIAKDKSAICWDKLARGVDTLVFLMGVHNLETITARLIDGGRAPETPAALVCRGASLEQRVVVTSLGQAFADAQEQGITPPAILVVGDVVKLREKLAWFDNRPLSGLRILVTRAREQASMLVDALEGLGAKCIEAPVIKITDPDSYAGVDQAIGNLQTYNWLIFTSVNGVDRFFARLRLASLDTRALGRAKIAAIGAMTAAKLREFGVTADVVPLEFRAEGIIDLLAERIEPGMKILIPRAAGARQILPDALSGLGAQVDVVEIYRTEIGDVAGKSLREMLAAGEIDIITFTSSSTVTNLLGILGENALELLNGKKVACIGPVTAATCLDFGIEPGIIADEFTIAGLVEAICNYCQG